MTEITKKALRNINLSVYTSYARTLISIFTVQFKGRSLPISCQNSCTLLDIR